MGQNQYTNKGRTGRHEPKIGRMVLLSLVFHSLLILAFSGALKPDQEKKERPVYYVDLTNIPVKDPQAGRPESRAKKAPQKVQPPKPAPVAPPKKEAPPQKTAVKKAPPPKKVPPSKPLVKKVPEKVSKPSAKPKPKPKKPVAKAAAPKESKKPKPQKAQPVTDTGGYGETLSAIEMLQKKMERKREREALKEKLAALAQSEEVSSPISSAPVGMPDGRGTQAGVDIRAYVETFIRKNWSFSRYQLAPGRYPESTEAKVKISYGVDGGLIDFRFTAKSGDSNFDDSIREAILRSKQLPRNPGSAFEVKATFNLKDMMDK